MRLSKRLASWLERLTSQAEVGARLWADYWLLIVGSCLVFGSVILKWVQFPFSHDLSGLGFSFLHDPGITAHMTLFSIGAIGEGVLTIGLILLQRYPLVLGLAAAILIMLWAVAPAQIAYRQPTMLRRLTDELQAAPMLNVFTKDYLAENYGSPELVPKRPFLYSALGRFNAAWSFLRLGWYCFGLGAFLVGAFAIGRLPGAKLSTTLGLLCLPLGALTAILAPPAIGQHFYGKGLLAKALGHDQEAVADFRKAMRWDAWHAHDVDLYATIGQLQEHTGDSDSPERHIRRAVEFRKQSEYEPAIFEFSLVDEAGRAIVATAKREGAATRIALGLALYHAGGIGAAVMNWEIALTEDPSRIYVLPYLARGYYDLGQYQAGIKTIDRLIPLIRDHNVALANAYSTAGDCYAKLGKDAESRRFYTLSLVSDPILNYWALTGLAGE